MGSSKLDLKKKNFHDSFMVQSRNVWSVISYLLFFIDTLKISSGIKDWLVFLREGGSFI